MVNVLFAFYVGVVLISLPIFVKVSPSALGQSYNYRSASEKADKYRCIDHINRNVKITENSTAKLYIKLIRYTSHMGKALSQRTWGSQRILVGIYWQTPIPLHRVDPSSSHIEGTSIHELKQDNMPHNPFTYWTVLKKIHLHILPFNTTISTIHCNYSPVVVHNEVAIQQGIWDN